MALVASLLALGAGCAGKSRKEVLAYFFDDVDEPPPATRGVRRNLELEIQKLQRDLAQTQRDLEATKAAATKSKEQPGRSLPAEDAKTWVEAEALLPKRESGQVDWVQALAGRTIAPRWGLDAEAPQKPVLDMDVDLTPASGAAFKVVFSHQAHTEWLGCDNCHPAIFQASKGANPMSMARIEAGEGCGACHGKVAFAVQDNCSRCHGSSAAVSAAQPEWRPSEEPRTAVERARTWTDARKLLPATAGSVDWAKALADGVIAPRPGLGPTAANRPTLPLDVELVPKQSAAFKVVFPHQAHTDWLGCESCHPALFPMAKGTTPITMAKIQAGEYCGACHGKVAFGIEAACQRCHSALPGQSKWRPSEAPRTPVEGARTWTDAKKLLPMTAGSADWAKALTDGVITPRPGLEPAATERPTLPMDVELVPKGSTAFKAVFPHQAHTEWLGCESCHPALFQMAKGTNPITMAKIQAGEYCGACHGKVAFGIEGACQRCHPALPGQPEWRPPETAVRTPPIERANSWGDAKALLPVTAGSVDWAKALADGVIAPRPGLEPAATARPTLPMEVEMIPEGNEPFKVVFPHQAHTDWLGCESCHPALFQMAKGTTPITMAKIQAGEYCGACHGKVAFPVEACGRCHAILAGAN